MVVSSNQNHKRNKLCFAQEEIHGFIHISSPKTRQFQ